MPGTDGGNAHAAVPGGSYPPAEYELSPALLRRLAEGSADVADLLAWAAHTRRRGTPAPQEREALPRKWAGL
ncbi:hypothetical protein ABTZ58_29275 [Streptomyces sp. NPDC094143]|uniref:hypothetical protein n=1 Tax=Streptomyces sp. NPDC094143 TaxID=3155310 RepID=UPI00331B8885